MQKLGDSILLSASDLVGHLNCGHLTGLDIAVATGTLEKPKTWDPLLEILWERGARHEQGFVEHLKSQGFSVTVIDGIGIDDEAMLRTKGAMHAGDEIIVQGAFCANGWVGRADVLRRIDTPSDLGAWSYEVIDTKLARETKGGTVLQLSLYAALVATVQGLRPVHSYVVAPWSDYEPQPYRMDDYAAYYRRVKNALEAALDQHTTSEVYPDPKEHCDICRWQNRCDRRRRADDHLSLVAGITKVHIDELKRRGTNTLAELAAMPVPLMWKPARGAVHSYERVREQARLQFAGREAGTVLHELLPVSAGLGLASLPVPSTGDIFLDLEGDPFAGDGGLEYLFGYTFVADDGSPAYTADWALSRAAEKEAFERFIDFVTHRLQTYPDLHIYHFAPYEPAALKRLMGRYASKEEEIDSLLRSKRLVDLYGVVRHGLRASVESYSIKRLEPLYGFTRNTALSEANKALAKVQACLELGDLEFIDESTRSTVAGYNRDDCDSTWQLRDWLETRRADLITSGAAFSRPEAPEGAPSEALGDWQQKITALIERLTADVPADVAVRTDDQQARWVLAHTLDWHRREQKALWWEYFRLSDLTAEDLLDERAGLAGLTFVGAHGGTVKAPIHRYAFPPQETEMRGSEDLRNFGGANLGKVHAISLDERWIDIKKRGDSVDVHPEAIFSHTVIGTAILADALVRIGEHVAEHGMQGNGSFLAARDLLMRLPPRLGGQAIQQNGELALDAACRVALGIKGGIFPIQGPPGSGKTYTGARMICALVQAGKTVGICANSHKVIRHLLDEVVKAAEDLGIEVQCIQKAAEVEPNQARLRFAKNSADLLGAIGNGSQVAGGTAWLWASPDAAQAVDVLFVDEAAQMALANVLAVSQAAASIVLLGDPQQLDQPMQGSHPEGTDVSALHHVLGEEQTISADRGLFLAETWRLHPDICAYTSEVFYAGRLHPRPGLEIQAIRSTGRVTGTGLLYMAVPTEGNQSSSPEEADAVRNLVDEILASGTTWIDKHGIERPITLQEILIIAPYNAQVFELKERISDARIGTVDKFQGQEAPIVIYSMTTSSYSDAPRGMEFLYSLNRLNVATSRAKCICILVASPSVFEAKCRTPRQMQLANAFCRYLELATQI
jgi:predicted RecB family nuclease